VAHTFVTNEGVAEMKSVALCLPLLAACYGAAPAKPARILLPPPVEAAPLVVHIDEPITIEDAKELVMRDESISQLKTDDKGPRRLPSVTSRSGGVIAMKRTASIAM
jgi:hypothetical protein